MHYKEIRYNITPDFLFCCCHAKFGESWDYDYEFHELVIHLMWSFFVIAKDGKIIGFFW